MQNKEIEELELDLKELKFLLQEAKGDANLTPVIKRHIGRFIINLEELRDKLPSQETNESLLTKTEAVSVEEINLVIEESAALEETVPASKVIEPIEAILPKAVIEEKKEILTNTTSSSTVLGEQLKPAAELSKGLTLNDTFRFSRELFNGEKDELNRALQEISKMNSMDEVTSYLSSQIEWDEENDAVKDFVELLKKYFV